MAKLSERDVKDLDVFVNPLDVRKDLHIFMEYVRSREVKRSYRGNGLPKSDAKRLAKLMSDSKALEEIKEHGTSSWVDFVDQLAFTLGFVDYDMEGQYMGYSSAEPSFPDNYIQPIEKSYQPFLESSLLEQERTLLQTMIKDYSYSQNEFMRSNILGILDTFSSRGCAMGVLPNLDFAKARMFLLDLLHKYESGIWYSTASLVAYLKRDHPYFLIPKRPIMKERWGREKAQRYGNFTEGDSPWGYGDAVPDHAPDGFERVEGRYMERFLEGIPLVLGYVDVAYKKNYSQEIYPAIDRLQAFRINNRLSQVMEGKIPPPRVTVQPNFEIQVDSAFYPVSVMAKLRPLSKLVSQDRVITLKLEKKRVSALLAEDDNLDVIGLLKGLASHRLPQNVLIELEEWAGHSKKFTLFDGFGILEASEEVAASANTFTVEHISPTIKLIRSPNKLFKKLEQAEVVPLRVKHSDSTLKRLPEKANTTFGTKSSVVKPKEKPRVTLKRETTVTLHFPTTELLERFCKELVYVSCPAEPDKNRRTVTYSTRYETEVKAVLKVVGKAYNISIQNI